MFDTLPSIIITGLVSILVWYVKERRREAKLAREGGTTIEQALLALIRNKMVERHTTYIKKWEITTAEKQSFQELHQMYIKLGGNGPTSHLIDDLDRVRLVVD